MKIKDESLDPYQIHQDGNNYSVMELTGSVDKKGNEIFKTHAYCSSVESAVNKISKLKTETDKEYNLKSYLYELRKQKQLITKSLII